MGSWRTEILFICISCLCLLLFKRFHHYLSILIIRWHPLRRGVKMCIAGLIVSDNRPSYLPECNVSYIAKC